MYLRLTIRSEQFKGGKALLLGQLEASWSKINHLKSEVQSSETEGDKLTMERNELKAEPGRLTLELSNGLVGNMPQIIVSELEKRGSVRILHLEGSAKTSSRIGPSIFILPKSPSTMRRSVAIEGLAGITHISQLHRC